MSVLSPVGEGIAIDLAACGKTYPDGTRAVEPLDLAIRPGETMVFLGPSGCGKTTTLRMIAGLEPPDAGGRILFAGRDVTALPIEKRNVGMVFQSYALFPNMNVAENIAYGLRVRGVAAAERRRAAGEVMEMMRIGELGNRRIDQLSGGQRQRVALARALAARPLVLLLDEPLTALDASLRETVRGEIDALLRSLNVTSIYVTHDQSEAMMLADRIVVMNRGRIAQIGTAREVYFQPADSFVAGFVGTLNRVEGRIRDGRFETPAGVVAVDRPDSALSALGFRPEAARLCAPDAATLTFTVAAVRFLGARQIVTLRNGEHSPVVVETDSRADLVPGTSVGLALDADAMMWF